MSGGHPPVDYDRSGRGLQRVDFCIQQVRNGRLEGRAWDETLPRTVGIPGEETVGPGGFSNCVRGIPVVLEMIRTLEQRTLHAIVLNLTNPSSLIQYPICKYTSMQVVGMCASPVALMKTIVGVLGLAA